MRTLIALLLPLFITSVSYSQKVTLADMWELNTNNIHFLDRYATRNGFEYLRSDSNEMVKEYIYRYKSNSDVTNVKSFLAKFFHKGGSKIVSFQTNDSAVYLSTLHELKTLGFVPTYTKIIQGANNSNFKKGHVELSIYSPIDIKTYNKKYPLFEISIKFPPPQVKRTG